MDFKNRCYLIVGGTSGMGLVSAIALKERGANVIAVGLEDIHFEHAKDKLGAESLVIGGDATDSKIIEHAVKSGHKKYGRIDGLFHVAGGSGRKYGDGLLEDMTLEAWNKTIALNLTTVMLSNKIIINYFIDHKINGKILNMGSVLASSPAPNLFATHAYAAAKSAIIGFSKSVAAYYAHNNICVNVISPSLIETPMSNRAAENEQINAYVKTKQPLAGGGFGKPEDIIDAVLMFLSPTSNFITGQVLAVDGGWSISEGQF